MAAVALRGSLLSLSLCALLAGGCAAPQDDNAVGSADSNVDTSGCSGGTELAASDGPFALVASRPPRKNCWNVPSAGLSVTYAWTQQNDATPRKDNVGFWTSINGAGVYAKADAYRCEEVSSFGYGHPTDNQRTYRCTAEKTFDFERFPELLAQAYQPSGERKGWAVEAAASLDDNGTWDSRGGANYRFSF
jgi:hypothetical protein